MMLFRNQQKECDQDEELHLVSELWIKIFMRVERQTDFSSKTHHQTY